jgi:hypothetical protein
MATKVLVLGLFSCMVVSAQESGKMLVVTSDTMVSGTQAPTILSVASSIDTWVLQDNNRHQIECSISSNPLYYCDNSVDNTFVGFMNFLGGAGRVQMAGYAYTTLKSQLVNSTFYDGNYYIVDESGSGDPVVAFGPSTNNEFPTLYYSYLFPQSQSSYRLFVNKVTGTNLSDLSWSSPVEISGVTKADKEWLAVDQKTHPNYLYLAYTEFGYSTPPICFVSSTNHGESFSTPVDISYPHTGFLAQGVSLAVGPNGDIYAIWSIYNSQLKEISIGFNKYTNAGVNWIGSSEIVTGINGIRGNITKSNGKPIRVHSQPSMAVSGLRNGWAGNIYIVWASKPSENSTESDIYLIKSTNGGTTWIGVNGQRIDQEGSPIRVNTDQSGNGKDQWFPSICVDDYGVITIIFYDCRNSSTNTMTEVWAARSSDGGNTFTDFRISDCSFGMFAANRSTYFAGDYISVCANRHNAIAAWADPRHYSSLFLNPNGSQGGYIYQIYVDKIDNSSADLSVAPLQPINVAVSSSQNYSPLVTWAANIESDLQYYEIWRSINQQGGAPGTFYLITTTTSNSYEDYDLHYAANGGWKVYYKIRAKDTQQQTSPYSEMVTARSDGWMKQRGKNNLSDQQPVGLSLNQNYPNPFNPTTTIRYSLPNDGRVRISLFDIMGRNCANVLDGWQRRGSHQIEYDGSLLASGTYIIRMRFEQSVLSKTITIIK